MNMDIRFHPLAIWPWPDTKARLSRYTFRADWANTLNLLSDELRHLKARDAVLEVSLRPEDSRIDGWPRAGARQPDHPGVILSFGSKVGALRYGTDAYETWQANLRAIGLSLKALRAVDRYGITRTGEQYTGWKQIGTGNAGAFTGPPPALNGRGEAEAFLLSLVGEDSVHALTPKTLYRAALSKAHPDRGGTAELFARVREAGEALGVTAG